MEDSMRNLHYLPAAPAVLLLVGLPLAPLSGQEDHAMKKDQPAAEGKLEGAEGHRASGTVHIMVAGQKRQLHLTPDFSVEEGPDVYVTLTNGPKPVEGASLQIAKLTRFSGEQSFDLPAGADPGRYSHLVLWCKKYSVAMGVAKLTHHAGKMEGMMEKEDTGVIEREEGGMMDKEGAMMEKGDTGKSATPE
jgi:Electron transfer DM13